jgi:hypothetical protein
MKTCRTKIFAIPMEAQNLFPILVTILLTFGSKVRTRLHER